MKKHLTVVQEEQLDLAYNGLPEEPVCSTFKTIPITTAEICAVLHPSHPLSARESIPLETLANDKIIMMDAQSKVKDTMTQVFSAHSLMPNIVSSYDQILCMVNLVKTCQYVGIISVASGRNAIGCEGLAVRPFTEPVKFDVGFIMKPGRYLPKVAHEFIRFIKRKANRK